MQILWLHKRMAQLSVTSKQTPNLDFWFVLLFIMIVRHLIYPFFYIPIFIFQAYLIYIARRPWYLHSSQPFWLFITSCPPCILSPFPYCIVFRVYLNFEKQYQYYAYVIARVIFTIYVLASWYRKAWLRRIKY